MKIVAAVLSTLSLLAMYGCKPKDQNSFPAAMPTASRQLAPSLIYETMGDDIFPIPTCTGMPVATRAFVFRIRKADIFNGPDDTTRGGGDYIKVKPTKNNGTEEEDGAGHENNPTYEMKPNGRGTPFDINLMLGNNEAVLFKIELQNGRLTFKPDKMVSGVKTVYALTAGDSNGLVLFCNATREGDKVAKVWIWNRSNVSGFFGSYNIGIDVKVGSGVIPITIDPNVKNNG